MVAAMLFSVGIFLLTGILSLAWRMPVEEVLALGEKGTGNDLRPIWLMHGLSIVLQLFVFGGAAMVMARLAGPAIAGLPVKRIPVASWGLAVLWVFVSVALIDATSFDAESFQLPSFLEGFERWAESTEAQIADQIGDIFKGGLFLTLISIAVLPAICEELFFRGFMQSVLTRWLGGHAGAIVQGILFSLFHGQVYGFIPRVIMGVAFGYMRKYTGSLMPGMVAHFVNNAVGVLALYYVQQGKLDEGYTEPTEGWPWMLAVGSAALSVLTLWQMKRLTIPVVPVMPNPEQL